MILTTLCGVAHSCGYLTMEEFMRRIQYALLASCAVIVLSAAAFAADKPVAPARVYTKAPIMAPAFSWTGFYIGGDVGYGWGTSTGTSTNATGVFPLPYSASPNGVIGGGFIGYNYQIDQFVVGVEADWQAANNSGSVNAILPPSYTMTTKVNNYGSLRGRLGYAMDRWMIFATGGWAWGSASTSYGFTGAAAPFYTNSFNGNGYTAGAGFEYAFMNNWLARVEYRYTDLGSRSYVDVPTNSAETGNRVTINDVRLGIAYKF